MKICEEKTNKPSDALQSEYVSIRAGRANPHVLDKTKVDYYGTPTPLQQVGDVTVPETRMTQIQLWEKSLSREIEKAIQMSGLGVNPTSDGSITCLIFPELAEECRKELAEDVKKKGEAAKVAMHNIRRDANDAIKKLERSGEIPEDRRDDAEEQIQKLTDKMVEKIDEAVEDKTEEIMTV